MNNSFFNSALSMAVAFGVILFPSQNTTPALPPTTEQLAVSSPVEQKPTLTRPAEKRPVSLSKQVDSVKPISVQTGIASWYGEPQRTAGGERFNPHGLTAAHRRLPLGTLIRVTNLKNNRQTVVKINDRGPYTKGRILDLSKAAARELAMINAGTAKVRVEVLPPAARYATL